MRLGRVKGRRRRRRRYRLIHYYKNDILFIKQKEAKLILTTKLRGKLYFFSKLLALPDNVQALALISCIRFCQCK
jgi:hypothetical protein